MLNFGLARKRNKKGDLHHSAIQKKNLARSVARGSPEDPRGTHAAGGTAAKERAGGLLFRAPGVALPSFVFPFRKLHLFFFFLLCVFLGFDSVRVKLFFLPLQPGSVEREIISGKSC